MNRKNLYIVDVRFKQKEVKLSKYNIKNDDEILTLTPYSIFIVKKNKYNYYTYHDKIINEQEYYRLVLNKYNSVQKIFSDYYDKYSFIFRDLSKIITFEVYIDNLANYLNKKKLKNYKIIYITDIYDKVESRLIHENLNYQTFLLEYDFIDEVYYIKSKDSFFYLINKIYHKITININKANLFKTIIEKLFDNSLGLGYDNINFKYLYKKLKPIDVKPFDLDNEIDDLLNKLRNSLINNAQKKFITKSYLNLFEQLKSIFSQTKSIRQVKFLPFVFLAKNNYARYLIYKKNKIPIIFMQHGSYFHKSLYVKNCEILIADVNFVFNDFTKKLFEKEGAKKVYSVGSINFNYPIKQTKEEYDFLYVAYSTSYEYTGIAVTETKNYFSCDGSNIFTRHIAIIELFGEVFIDKTICLKLQGGIITEEHLYVPLLEISDKYSNVFIEFSKPISKLVQRSKYILSDYFSSEFINRDMHYKKNIFLFKDFPMSIEKEYISDMNKLFILVDSVEDLKIKITNMKDNFKARKRFDKIISYYTSNENDTKKLIENKIKDHVHKLMLDNLL